MPTLDEYVDSETESANPSRFTETYFMNKIMLEVAQHMLSQGTAAPVILEVNVKLPIL